MNIKPILQTKLYGFNLIFNEIINLFNSKKLPNKILQSQHFMPVMGGIDAEYSTKTTAIESQDSRATLNTLYSPKGTAKFLQLAKKVRQLRIEQQIALGNNHPDPVLLPLLYGTNNFCNNYCYKDPKHVIDSLLGSSINTSRKILLSKMQQSWGGRSHLKNKNPVFDWSVMKGWLDFEYYSSKEGLVTERKKLFVGVNDPTVQVLVKYENREGLTTNQLMAERRNLVGTEYIGDVISLKAINQKGF